MLVIPLNERNVLLGHRDHSEENDRNLHHPKYSKTKGNVNCYL